jgi:hypothetical protein
MESNLLLIYINKLFIIIYFLLMREREIKKIKEENNIYKKYSDGEIEELKLEFDNYISLINSIGLDLESLNRKKTKIKYKKNIILKERGKTSNKSSSSENE